MSRFEIVFTQTEERMKKRGEGKREILRYFILFLPRASFLFSFLCVVLGSFFCRYRVLVIIVPKVPDELEKKREGSAVVLSRRPCNHGCTVQRKG